VIRHVLAGSGSEVEVVNLIDFTDRRGHDYAVDLRRCVGYMFATVVAASVSLLGVLRTRYYELGH
jgi:hypothetical protein